MYEPTLHFIRVPEPANYITIMSVPGLKVLESDLYNYNNVLCYI